MLAFTDSALARLAIAATAVAPEQRERWLRDIADRVDPPLSSPAKMSPAAIRPRKLRANRAAGKHCYTMWLSDRAVEGLIMRLILGGRLSEEQAMRPRAMVDSRASRLLW